MTLLRLAMIPIVRVAGCAALRCRRTLTRGEFYRSTTLSTGVIVIARIPTEGIIMHARRALFASIFPWCRAAFFGGAAFRTDIPIISSEDVGEGSQGDRKDEEGRAFENQTSHDGWDLLE
jgi:hypothetical protein